MLGHRLLPLVALLACASLEQRPEWVLKGFDPHGDPNGARLTAVGHVSGSSPKGSKETTTRYVEAETAARKALLKRLTEIVPLECQKQVSQAVSIGPITEHWVASDESEYALAEISQGTLWELCPAMTEREIAR